MPHAASAGDTPLNRGNEFEIDIMDQPVIPFNAASAISYFTFIPAVALLLIPRYKESANVRFHAWQSILLFIAASATDIVLGGIALLTIFLGTTAQAYSFRMLFLFWLILWAACVIVAFKGKRFKLPIIGGIAEKLSLK
jgi:uncharacterized membrane protein